MIIERDIGSNSVLGSAVGSVMPSSTGMRSATLLMWRHLLASLTKIMLESLKFDRSLVCVSVSLLPSARHWISWHQLINIIIKIEHHSLPEISTRPFVDVKLISIVSVSGGLISRMLSLDACHNHARGKSWFVGAFGADNCVTCARSPCARSALRSTNKILTLCKICRLNGNFDRSLQRHYNKYLTWIFLLHG